MLGTLPDLQFCCCYFKLTIATGPISAPSCSWRGGGVLLLVWSGASSELRLNAARPGCRCRRSPLRLLSHPFLACCRRRSVLLPAERLVRPVLAPASRLVSPLRLSSRRLSTVSRRCFTARVARGSASGTLILLCLAAPDAAFLARLSVDADSNLGSAAARPSPGAGDR